MVFNNELQLDMPDAFPAQEFASFMAASRAVLLAKQTDTWKEFGGATNLIGWRFRSTHEDMTTYVDSWNTKGANVSFEEIYLRERALFGMFGAGVSCIESSCYALYALASHPSVLAVSFGEPEQRRCSPSRLRDVLVQHTSAQGIASALTALINAYEWRFWVDLRNRMTHRSNLPRIICAAVGAAPPPEKALQFAATSSTPAFEADASHLESLFLWLAQSLRVLLSEGRRLTSGP